MSVTGPGAVPAMVTVAATATDTVTCSCLRLGWRLEELFNRFEVPGRPPQPYGVERLPGRSELTSYDVQRLGLDEADFVVKQVTARVGAPAAVPLELTTDARRKLEAAAGEGDAEPSRRAEYRAALVRLHVDLLVTLTAADASYGKAYGLGRALADTTRPGQSLGELATAFRRDRISELGSWLDELASRLPEHSARAVAQSVTWWQQAVAAASGSPALSASDTHAGLQGNGPAARRRLLAAAAALGLRSARAEPDHANPVSAEGLTDAVARQGALWRSVLDGNKLCIDLLGPQDYLQAGDRLARHYADLVGRTLRTMPWLLVLLLSLLAAVVLTLIFIPGSAVARTATAAAAIAGTFSGIWKLIRTRIAPIAAQLERPLWGAELNTAVAEALTIAPVRSGHGPRS